MCRLQDVGCRSDTLDPEELCLDWPAAEGMFRVRAQVAGFRLQVSRCMAGYCFLRNDGLIWPSAEGMTGHVRVLFNTAAETS